MNKNLIADYKHHETPASERLFDAFTDYREETKQSLRRDTHYNYNKNTESTLYDFFNKNESYISDGSLHLGDVHKTQFSSRQHPNTTDSMDISKRMHANLGISRKLKKNRGRNSRRFDDGEPYNSNGITLSSIIKRKGKDSKLDNILKTVEKQQNDDNSAPDSPYFSTQVKAIRSNRVADSSHISENPSLFVNVFQKKLSLNPINSDTREEMNIQDEQNAKQQNNFNSILSEQLEVFNAKAIAMSLENNPSDHIELSKLKLMKKIENQLEGELIMPKHPYRSTKKAGSRQMQFEESCRGVNSISLDRASSKTPDLAMTHNITNIKIIKKLKPNNTQTQKVSFGVLRKSDLPSRNFDSIHSDKFESGSDSQSHKSLNLEQRKSITKFTVMTSKMNKKIKRYQQRREESERFTYANKANRASCTLDSKE